MRRTCCYKYVLLVFLFVANSNLNAIEKKVFDGLPSSEYGYINKLLTYSLPTQAEVFLPQDAANAFPLFVYFHKKIDPTNIIVELNGKDISDLFVFEPGESFIVDLPLEFGENIVKLRALELVEGNSGETPQWDYDNFTIHLPRPSGGLELIGN
ncbi:MAG: hypothetical protein OEZ38_14470 [Gammaproteobacteria bacterium]|nr:hypothetical protein [Gammaproteobacteria bacterium]